MNEARSSGTVIDRDAAAALMEPLTDLVIRAGAAILAVNRAAMQVDGKLDGSPVTEADLAADRIIAEGLARLAPEFRPCPRSASIWRSRPISGSFFLIDPLDGTKEFVAGRDEFTVNLALVTNGTPLLGIIGAPALGLIWRGLVGRGAERLTVGEQVAWRPSRSIPAASRSAASPGSWPSAARMATAGPKPSSRRARRGPRDARLGGQIRPGGGRRRRYLSPPRPDHPNGMSRRDTRSSPRPAARSRMRRALTLQFGSGPRRLSSCRNSSPGAIPSAAR